jgi:hypothetical protein
MKQALIQLTRATDHCTANFHGTLGQNSDYVRYVECLERQEAAYEVILDEVSKLAAPNLLRMTY